MATPDMSVSQPESRPTSFVGHTRHQAAEKSETTGDRLGWHARQYGACHPIAFSEIPHFEAGVTLPKRPCASSLMPAVKNRVLGSPAFLPLPNRNPQRPI